MAYRSGTVVGRHRCGTPAFLRNGARSFKNGPTVDARQLRGRGRKQVLVQARAARYDRRRPPPPDLPSMLFDQRIVYLGMPLVPAVTELMVAELLYLEKQGAQLPVEMLINSSGTTRQDGEILAFDSEGIALTSTMGFIKNPISTVNMGLAVGWACIVLAFGKKGWRKSLPHSLAMLQQPRIPPTGQRQAIEVHIKWREVLDYKRDLLRMLSIGTGWPVEKLDADMQRPLYMRPIDALEYGIIDEVIEPNKQKQTKAARYWVKSGRAESDGRLEQWKEYIEAQERYSMDDQLKKVVAQDVRQSYRDASKKLLTGTQKAARDIAEVKKRLPPQMLVGDNEIRLPFSQTGLQAAVLNAEPYAENNVNRRRAADKIKIPASWKEQYPKESPSEPEIDYPALIRKIEAMDAEDFAKIDIDDLSKEFAIAK